MALSPGSTHHYYCDIPGGLLGQWVHQDTLISQKRLHPLPLHLLPFHSTFSVPRCGSPRMACNTLVIENSCAVHEKASGQCSQWYDLLLCCPLRIRELDSVVLIGAFPHEIFYDSMKYRTLGIMQKTLQKTHRLKDFVCSLLSLLVSVDWEKK